MVKNPSPPSLLAEEIIDVIKINKDIKINRLEINKFGIFLRRIIKINNAKVTK